MKHMVVVFTAGMLALGSVYAQAPSPDMGEAIKLIDQFYKEHDGKSDPLQYPASRELLPNYFHKPLLDLYLKDQADSEGEVDKVDFDPLFDAQDFKITDFTVVVLSDKKGSESVAARFRNMGSAKEIVFVLQTTEKGWRIADIRYKGGRSLWKILRE